MFELLLFGFFFEKIAPVFSKIQSSKHNINQLDT